MRADAQLQRHHQVMAAKVRDGLFIGDAETSMDADFLQLNKITNLINTSGHEVQNVFAGHGFVYQTFCWEDRPDFLVFPDMERDQALLDVVEFIDVSLRRGLSVLVFSVRGVSRSALVVCAYLMCKFHWGFEKAYDFVYTKKADLQLNQGFVQQLFTLEKRLAARRQKALKQQQLQQQGIVEPEGEADVALREKMRRKEWDNKYIIGNKGTIVNESAVRPVPPRRAGGTSNADEMSEDEAEEELLLVNSFVNGRNTITALPGPFRDALNAPKAFKLRFNDELQEEDIHMFPTDPMHPEYMPPGGGILKGVKRASNSGNSSSSSSSLAKKKHDALVGSDEGRGQVRFASKGPATSPTNTSKGAPHKASFRPGDHYQLPTQHAHNQQLQQQQQMQQQQHYTYGGASVGFMDDVDERDLYDFVGMGQGSRGASSSGTAGTRVPPTTTPTTRTPGSSSSSSGSGSGSGSAPTSPPRTAEDRLRTFMREMHLQQQQQLAALAASADEKGGTVPLKTASAAGSKGSPAKGGPGGGSSPQQHYKQQRPVSFAVGEDADAKRYDRKSVDFEDAAMTPSLSLYDLAAMPLEMSVDSEYKSTTATKYRSGAPSSAPRNGRHHGDDGDDHYRATSKPAKTTRYADDKGGGTYLLEQERIVLSRSQQQQQQQQQQSTYARDRGDFVDDDHLFDPLAAFQHGAAVRVRHDVTQELAALGVGTKGRGGDATGSARAKGGVRNAWVDDDVNAHPRGKSPLVRQQPHTKAATAAVAAAPSSSDYSSGPAVARTYRHGSPAQVRSMRPGTAPGGSSSTSAALRGSGASRPKAFATATGSKPRVGQSPARGGGGSQAQLLQPPPAMLSQQQRRGSFDSLSFDNVSAFDSLGSGRVSRPASPSTKARGYPSSMGTARANQHPNQFVGAPRSSTPTSSRGWR